jgi:phosphoglycerate kinase
MTDYLTLDHIDCAGKTVIVRADLNVPAKDGVVTDTTRIDRLAPTLAELVAGQAKVVVISHFGRPKVAFDPAASLEPVVAHLSRVLGMPVRFASNCIGADVLRMIKDLQHGEVLLLENLRFHAGEEGNDRAFAKELAALGDIYVNDAFSAAHRAHASVSGVPEHLPAYAGRLMEAELNALAKALETPARPLIALVGGAKISTKLDLIGNLLGKVDKLILGGGMANTFLAAKGFAVGKSLCETDMLEQARTIMATAEARGCKILLPVDVVVAPTLAAGVVHSTVDVADVPTDQMILDIGPESIEMLIGEIAECKTIVWNGPLGVFEVPPFDRGTVAVAAAVAEATRKGELLSVAGGGDTTAALAQAGTSHLFTYVSSAGGAFLEWLEGKTLPGVAALKAAKNRAKDFAA